MNILRTLSFLVLECSNMVIHSTPLHIPFRSPDLLPDHQNSTLNLSTRATIQCDQRYGENLDILDCQNAISQFNPGTDLLALADRRAIVPGDEDTLPLPFRLMGSKFPVIHSFLALDSLRTRRFRPLLCPTSLDGGSLLRQSEP